MIRAVQFRTRFFSACDVSHINGSAQALPSGDLRVLPVDEALSIAADRQALAAVVANLLQNAFKFTRPGTTVTLRVGASAERVLIEVEDECGGLPSGDVNELFRPFEQRSTDRTGVGLGLAFSRWGGEANEGRIYARNLPGISTEVFYQVEIAHALIHLRIQQPSASRRNRESWRS